MTVFTAVSIAISTTGATFTALNQFSGVLDDHLKRHCADGARSHSLISETVADDSTTRHEAHRHSSRLPFWMGLWKYCAIAPITVLLTFSFWVGVKAILWIYRGGGEDIGPSDRAFFLTWISLIIGVNFLALFVKAFSWWRIRENKLSLAKMEKNVSDGATARNGAMKITPSPANTPSP